MQGPKKHDEGLLHLKIGLVLLLLLDNGRLVSGPSIHAQFLQAFAKTARRNQLISSLHRQD
jgi:hypothetical protein